MTHLSDSLPYTTPLLTEDDMPVNALLSPICSFYALLCPCFVVDFTRSFFTVVSYMYYMTRIGSALQQIVERAIVGRKPVGEYS